MAIVCMFLIVGGTGFAIYYFSKGDKNAKVVATTFPIYDICRELLGNNDDLALLEDSGTDMHSFSPTTSDNIQISNAELFIHIGGESDNWVGGVLETTSNTDMQVLSLIDYVDKLEEHHHHHEGEEEHKEECYDEHIWLSIKNMINMTEAIKNSLINIFPERQELIKINAEKYIGKLSELESKYQVLQDNSNKLIFADRFPFRYLMNDYNLDYYALFNGCSTESEADFDAITDIINEINSADASYIFILENTNSKTANNILNDHNCKKGVEILTLNSCQSININNIDNISYLQIMEDNLEKLKKAVNL